MELFTVYGVEHVYDAFDEYEHPNHVLPFRIWAEGSDSVLRKAESVLQNLITDNRRAGGFLSSGDFVGEVVQIMSQAGDIVFGGREEHTYIFGGTVERYSLKPLIHLPASNLIPIINDLSHPEFESTVDVLNGTPGILLVPQDIRLIQHLCQQPEDIFRLTAREFEEFVAGVLGKLGYSTHVTPLGPDSGVDVFAERESIIGHEFLVVQCKRWAPQRRIPRPVVQQLGAIVRDHKASRGLIVTTSYFSGPALQYMEQRKYVLSGADNTKLFSWLDYIRERS